MNVLPHDRSHPALIKARDAWYVREDEHAEQERERNEAASALAARRFEEMFGCPPDRETPPFIWAGDVKFQYLLGHGGYGGYWLIWNKCPKCGTAVASKPCYTPADIGQMLYEFQPEYSHFCQPETDQDRCLADRLIMVIREIVGVTDA